MCRDRINWQALFNDFADYNQRSARDFTVRMTELSKISGAIWGQFCNRIQNANIQQQIRNADSFDDICEILEGLNVPGIGADTIISIAAKIAYDLEKPLDDSCFSLKRIEGNPKMRNILQHFSSLEEIRDSNHLLENFSDKDLFLLLVLSKSRIAKSLR